MHFTGHSGNRLLNGSLRFAFGSRHRGIPHLLGRAARLCRLSLIAGGLVVAGASSQAVFAADAVTGDAAAGKGKAAVCSACHGQDGKALLPEYPNLAGQGAGYIAKQLMEYKSGERNNAIMLGMASPLSEQDMADLGAYYESLAPIQGIAEDSEDLESGESIYRGGVTSAKIPACMSCHGPAGRGNPAAKWPALAGQNTAYTAQQLRLFRSGERNNDINEMMRMVAHRLSDAEIDALANYLQGLN